jgi:chromosome segregation ATPase
MVLPSALVGDRNSDYKKQCHVPDSGPGEKLAPNSARFRLKSQAPEEVWQEQLALYRIAHRLGLEKLWKTSLAILTKEVDSALQSINVTQFIREVYSLGQDEAQSLRGEVATKTVEQDPLYLTKPTLDVITLSLPAFGCDLIEAMKKKDVNRTETIHALQLLNDKREEEIADYKQGIKLSQHKEMLAAHKAELRGHWTRTREVKAKATELRKELIERKRAFTEQKADTAKQKKEIAQQKKEITQLKNHMAQLEQGSGASGQPYPSPLPSIWGSISNKIG